MLVAHRREQHRQQTSDDPLLYRSHGPPPTPALEGQGLIVIQLNLYVLPLVALSYQSFVPFPFLLLLLLLLLSLLLLRVRLDESSVQVLPMTIDFIDSPSNQPFFLA